MIGVEARDLVLGLSLAGYPAAFPWRSYTRLYPRAAAHRWAALAPGVQAGRVLRMGESGMRLAEMIGVEARDLVRPVGIRIGRASRACRTVSTRRATATGTRGSRISRTTRPSGPPCARQASRQAASSAWAKAGCVSRK
jgi:hypothetical protein